MELPGVQDIVLKGAALLPAVPHHLLVTGMQMQRLGIGCEASVMCFSEAASMPTHVAVDGRLDTVKHLVQRDGSGSGHVAATLSHMSAGSQGSVLC